MKTKLTVEQYEQIQRVVVGISRKKHGWANMNAEEWEQELWLKVLNMIEACNEVPSLNLIASSCYNYVTDTYRKFRHRQDNNFSMQPDIVNDMIDDGCGTTGHAPNGDFSSAVIDEMRNMFAEGSKEETYFDLVMDWVGLTDKTTKELNQLFLDGTQEYEIAINMGYANQSSNGYRRVRNRVREAVADYRDGLRNENLEKIRG